MTRKGDDKSCLTRRQQLRALVYEHHAVRQADEISSPRTHPVAFVAHFVFYAAHCPNGNQWSASPNSGRDDWLVIN